jgi:hypothetical protein
VEAMISAKDDIADSKHQDKHKNGNAKESFIIHIEEEDEKRKTFKDELVKAGYDLELATKALDHVDPEDISEGMVAICVYFSVLKFNMLC